MSDHRPGPFLLPPDSEPRQDLPEWESQAWYEATAPQQGIETLYAKIDLYVDLSQELDDGEVQAMADDQNSRTHAPYG